MIKLMFVCHGNICRSPMAEFVFRDMVFKKGLGEKFLIASSATSTEEIGHKVHPGTREILQSVGISCKGKIAVQLKSDDYEKYDYFIAMDFNNIVNMMRIFTTDPDGKIFRLLDFTADARDIADPWYTGNFERTFGDVVEGCEGLLKFIELSGGL